MPVATVDPSRQAQSRAAIRTVVDDERRVIALDAVHNFRDLGRYRLGDGRTIAWGRLFRADGLYRLTDDDLGVLDALGIRTVIDLRSSKELTDQGTFPVDRYPVAFHHLAIIDATWMQGDIPEFANTEQGSIDFLIWAYRDMLRNGADRFAHAVQLLAVPEAMPAVFHCAAGKDRTGIMTALIMAALGVDHEVVVADYAITEAAMRRMRVWVTTNHPEMAERMGETPAFMLAAHPAAMRQILTELCEQYGSVRAYLSSIGVGTALLADLADTITA